MEYKNINASIDNENNRLNMQKNKKRHYNQIRESPQIYYVGKYLLAV